MEHIRNLTLKETIWIILISLVLTTFLFSMNVNAEIKIDRKNIVMTPEVQRYIGRQLDF